MGYNKRLFLSPDVPLKFIREPASLPPEGSDDFLGRVLAVWPPLGPAGRICQEAQFRPAAKSLASVQQSLPTSPAVWAPRTRREVSGQKVGVGFFPHPGQDGGFLSGWHRAKAGSPPGGAVMAPTWTAPSGERAGPPPWLALVFSGWAPTDPHCGVTLASPAAR